MSHLSASRVKVGGALVLVAATSIGISLTERRSSSSRSSSSHRDSGCIEQSPAIAAPLIPGQTTLPKWFGLPDSPAHRIAGQLFDANGPLVGTVHLRIEAPDATIWKGLDQTTTDDGHFDFGELRAGRYNILASAAGKSSRLFRADTTTSDATALAIYAYACTSISNRVVTTRGKPVASAQIDIGGVVMTTTDAAGRYSLCLTSETVFPAIRAPGYVARQRWTYHGEIRR